MGGQARLIFARQMSFTCVFTAQCTAVGNLPYELTEQEMADYFSQCGPVKAVRCVPV